MEADCRAIEPRSDPRRLGAAQAGDQAAFESLFEPLLESAYRVAVVMLRDRAQAEDAVQEAALRAWRSLPNFRGGPEQLRPWFLKIVTNQCRSLLRSRRPSPVLWAVAPSPEDHVIEVSDLARSLARLAPPERLALQLRYHLDLPVEEVAAVLGLTVNGAKARLRRALRRIRPHLGVEEDDLS